MAFLCSKDLEDYELVFACISSYFFIRVEPPDVLGMTIFREIKRALEMLPCCCSFFI